jgi:uncharacterized membrane protein YjdF
MELPKFGTEWDKKLISLIMVVFMCFAIYTRIPLDQMFYTILFFMLGIHMGNNQAGVAAAANAQLNEQVKKQQATIENMATQAMKTGAPVVVPVKPA